MKAAIYARVSRTDLNLDNQLMPLVEYAKKNNWEYEIFTEEESTRNTRPVQWGLYNRLLKRNFDILLIYRLDRWARSLQELVAHVENLTKNGIRVISYTENLDYDTSMGKLMFHQIAAFAQYERDMIRERTLAGLARAKAQGKKLGRPRGSTQKSPRKITKIMIEKAVAKYLQENGDMSKSGSFDISAKD